MDFFMRLSTLAPSRLFLRLLKNFRPARVREFIEDEFVQQTDNYGNLTWLGNPIWQNVSDLWVIQEVISTLKPSLLIETGTNRGGSSLFYAHLMDLLGSGSIITVDMQKLHELSHPRITYCLGSSTSPEVLNRVEEAAASATGPVLVILDSDHSEEHVFRELNCYHAYVTTGSYVLVQDGIIDTLPRFAAARPGPLPAIERFLAAHPEFQIDEKLCGKFPVSHHPKGWLRRLPSSQA